MDALPNPYFASQAVWSRAVEQAQAILDADAESRRKRRAEREAARLGIGTLLLEVGTRNEEAHAMYRRAGFLPRGAFAPYDATPISRFLEKRLSSPSPPPAR